jgi:signal transduction histidine kinase
MGMAEPEGRTGSQPRRSARKAIAQFDAVQSDRLPTEALDAVPDLVAVLNSEREVVFANRAFLSFAGAGDITQVFGIRPGELFGCVNARSAPEGCGTGEACAGCGAAAAIDDSLRTGSPATRDCSLTIWAQGRRTARDLSTHSLPFEIAGSSYVMVVFRDVGQRVRRLALERIFFHDLLNTVSSFKLYLDLLKAAEFGHRENDLIGRLDAICSSLVEEIQGQRTLVAAENGTLSVQHNLVDAYELASGLVRQFEAKETPRGRTVALAPFSEVVTLVTDDSLARRVLSNMLKNALEASPEGSTVTLGCRAAGERVEFRVHNPGAMPEDVQRRVFQRSFSTKGEGRGLGTWSMKLLAEDYLGGAVWFSSSPADGTTFFLGLPLRPARAQDLA